MTDVRNCKAQILLHFATTLHVWVTKMKVVQFYDIRIKNSRTTWFTNAIQGYVRKGGRRRFLASKLGRDIYLWQKSRYRIEILIPLPATYCCFSHFREKRKLCYWDLISMGSHSLKSSKKSHFSKASEASFAPQSSHQPPKAATVRVVLWHIWDNINDFRTLCSILEDSISTQRKYVDLRSNQKILFTRRSIQKVLMGSSKLYLHLTSRKIGSLSTS